MDKTEIEMGRKMKKGNRIIGHGRGVFTMDESWNKLEAAIVGHCTIRMSQ